MSFVTPVSMTRVAIDWDGDFFICYDARPGDGLNIMHNLLSSDPGLVNLHWNGVDDGAISGATVTKKTAWTDQGVRQLHVISGTNIGAGGYFGYTGSGSPNFIVATSTPYTAVLWIKASSGAGVPMKLGMVNSTDAASFTLTTSWQKVTLNFTTSVARTAFKVYKDNDATNVTFDVTGFMIVAGSTAPGGFNVGVGTNLYDVLDRRVKSADISMGQIDWTKRWMDEGKAKIVVKNIDRVYSPEYSSSPLYGAIGPRRLMTVDIKAWAATTWERLFSGWTEDILPETRQISTRNITIKATQGRFQLDKVPFNTLLSGNYTIDQIITQVLKKGFVSAATPVQAVASMSKAGASYASDFDAMFALETGVSSIPVNPEAWGGGVKASRVLEELLEIEQGFFFINRSGKAYFYNRHHYVDPAVAPTPISIDLDDKSTDSEYQFNKPYYNHALVTYHPPSTRVDTIWESRGYIRLRRRQRRKVVAKFEYTEGKKMTVLSVNDFDGTADASTITIHNGPASAESKLIKEVKLENGQAVMHFKNGSTSAISLYITLKGTIQESVGGSVIERTADVGVVGGKETLDKKNVRQIETEDEANNYAAYLLDLFRGGIGQIQAFTMMSINSTRLAEILAVKLGETVDLTEYQTGHSGSYAVVGEHHVWNEGGVLTSTYNLFPLHRLRAPWVLGTSQAGDDVYLAY